MTLYTLAVFLHVMGAMAVFALVGFEWIAVAGLGRSETAEQARQWGKILPFLPRLGPVTFALILIPGIYLAVTGWRGTAWPWVALVALLLLPPLGAVNGKRLGRAQEVAAAERGSLSESTRQLLRHRFLLASLKIRLAVLTGIVFLMTVKPTLALSVLAAGIALVVGIAFALPGWLRGRAVGASRAA